MENSDFQRPDPDLILKQIKKDSDGENVGRLKIFFGMCAGVGKTYAMLEDAQKAKNDGVDVVIGIVETHGRRDTERLTAGLESIPRREINYRGTVFREMDLDAVMGRNPSLVIVDELAHTNITGSRHIKRYQDVLELLNHGISVYTTLNVQHLESRAEIVKQITGAVVRETLPDSIFDRADEIELVDITPDELLQRLSEGKVYTPERSVQAVENFFRKGNITALREMALRLTAERVDKQLRDYMSEKNIPGAWKSSQTIMVSIGPSPYSAELIRWARRLAYSMEARWIAAYIETDQKISDENKELLLKNFELAKELGAEVISTNDKDIVQGLLRVAREQNVSQIIIGKARKKYLLDYLLKKEILNSLINKSGNIDVHVVGGEIRSPQYDFSRLLKLHSYLGAYIISSLIILGVGLAAFPFHEKIGYQTVSLIFLLVVSVLPLFKMGPGPVMLAAILAALGWDFFFIPPLFTFHIDRPEDLLMLVVFFIVAIVTGVLSARSRSQELAIRAREERTNYLYKLTSELSLTRSINDVAAAAVTHIQKVFDSRVCIYLTDNSGVLNKNPHPSGGFDPGETGYSHAHWVFKNKQKAGKFTQTLPSAEATYYPMESRNKIVGVIGIRPGAETPLGFEQQALLDTFIKQIATVAEREYLNESAKQTTLLTESEKLYRNLFNSISHELKTPITAVLSASSGLKEAINRTQTEAALGLTEEISIAGNRLTRLVENLLDMARIDSGIIKPIFNWHDVGDLVSQLKARLKDEIIEHKFIVKMQDENPPFKFDFALIEQALLNIIRNSINYTPQGTEISLEITYLNDYCYFIIKDNGPGFPEATAEKVFDKFYRVPGTKAGGTGLGLSIAKGFIESHKGEIKLVNNPGKGVTFTISIPVLAD